MLGLPARSAAIFLAQFPDARISGSFAFQDIVKQIRENLRVSEQMVWSLVTKCQNVVEALKTDSLAYSLNLSEKDSENEHLHYRFVCMSNNELLDRVIIIKRGGWALKSEASPYLFNNIQ